MKTLLTLTLVVLMAGSAFAQLDNSIGIFFVDEGFENPDNAAENTNFDPTIFSPYNAYVCLVGATMFSVGAYEVGIEISDDSNILISAVGGPNGWTNFGQNLNHLAGYMTPVPCSAGYAVLSTITLVYTSDSAPAEPISFYMGPAFPSSVDEEGPAIADGANVDIVYVLNYTSGPSGVGVLGEVATLFGDGITFPGGVATEAHSLSSVKALFN